MVWEKYENKGADFISTSMGIVTSEGIFFHITEEAINRYASGLLNEVDIDTLVTEAVGWVKSASNLSLLLYIISAAFMSYQVALMGTLLFFALWFYLRSALVSPTFGRIMVWINSDLVLIGSTLIGLSYLGMTEKYVAFGIGLVFYLIFKIDIIRRLLDNLLPRLNGSSVPFNDRIFHILITKYAVK